MYHSSLDQSLSIEEALPGLTITWNAHTARCPGVNSYGFIHFLFYPSPIELRRLHLLSTIQISAPAGSLFKIEINRDSGHR
jgi:hypothetical protein